MTYGYYQKYEDYQRRMQQIFGLLYQIKRHLILIIVIAAVIVASTLGLMAMAGDLTSEIVMEDYFYGSPVEPSARAFLSKVSFEYAPQGTTSWSSESPDGAGEYLVRAVTQNGFGTFKYSAPTAFTIKPVPLTVDVRNASLTYGDPIAYTRSDLKVQGLIAGDSLDAVTFTYTEKTLLQMQAVPGEFVIRNAQGKDVTSFYEIKAINGIIDLVPRGITVSSESLSKLYDATPLIGSNEALQGGSLAEGDVLRAKEIVTVSITDVGQVENAFVAVIEDAAGRDVSSCYQISYDFGVYRVDPLPLTIKTANATKIYDGKPLGASDYNIVNGKLVDGHVLNLEMPSITQKGTMDNVPMSYTITDAKGVDVTKNYHFVCEAGKLTVESRPLTVTTADATKLYDGTALSAPSYTITKGELVAGQNISLKFPSQVDAGAIDNMPTLYSILEGEKNVTSNYNITWQCGKLTVTPRKIVVTTPNATKVYDDKPFYDHNANVSGDGLAEGHIFHYYLGSSPINAGKYENKVTIRIFDKADNEVTNRGYEIKYAYGTLEITPRPVEVKSGSTTKPYSGKPVTCKNLEYSKGFVEGHMPEASFTGSQTEVGSSPNTFDVTHILSSDGQEKPVGNYLITKLYGTITVTQSTADNTPSHPSEDGDSSIGFPPPAEEGGGSILDIQFTTPHNDTMVYLRERSLGAYTGVSWKKASPYSQNMVSTYAADTLNRSFFTSSVGLEIVANVPGTSVVPYYTPTLPSTKQDNDVKVTLASDKNTFMCMVDVDYNDVTSLRSLNPLSDYQDYVYKNYLQIPAKTKTALLKYAEENGIKANSPTLVTDIQKLIQHAAVYDMDAAHLYPNDVDDIAVHFLTVAKKGICQHFATAATLMYRAFGIPARYTVGFAATAAYGKVTHVTGGEAHAWTEVYVDDVGWIYMEVTAGGPDSSGSGGKPSETPGQDGSNGGAADGMIVSFPSPADGKGEPIGTISTIKVNNQPTLSSTRQVYLREKSYGSYTGLGWGKAPIHPDTKSWPHLLQTGSSLKVNGVATAEETRIKVKVNQGNVTLLPYYTYTRSSIALFTDVSFYYQGNNASFSVRLADSYKAIIDNHATRTMGTYSTYVKETYLEIPSDTKAALLKLAEENGIHAGSATLITDIQSFIQKAARYDPNAASLYGDDVSDVAVHFLTVAKRGICQHFATAATLMYRAFGIPARYTEGYKTELHPTNETTFTSDDAHAWVEIFVDNVGWVYMEVTAGMSKPELTISSYSRTKEYDGQPFDDWTYDKYWISSGELKAGHRLTVTVADGYVNKTSAGSDVNKITSYQILDASGKDVTAQYIVQTEEGESTILKRKITIKTASATKVHDGEPLVCDVYWITQGSVAPGHTMQVIMKEPFATVGNRLNKVSEVIIKDLRTGSLVDKEYEITFDYGRLFITAAK